VDAVFSSFDAEACGAASIGQAHRATVRRTGQDVVVKVQYPDASWMVAADIRAIGGLLKLMVFFGAVDEGPATLSYDEFSRQFMAELDYVQERRNLEDVYASTASRFSGKVVIPDVVDALCAERVITMTYLSGPKLEEEAKRQLAALGVDVKRGVKEMVQEAADKRDADVHGILSSSVFEEDASAGASAGAGAGAGVGAGAVGNTGGAAGYVVSLLGPDRMLWLARTARITAEYGKGWAAYTVTLCSSVGLASDGWAHWATQITAQASARGGSGSNAQVWMDTLFEVHGHEIFCTKVFNADPHPGNIIVLPDDRLGLIDYGQCKRLDSDSRLKIARIIVAVAERKDDEEIAGAFRSLGLITKNDSTAFIATFAKLIFGRIKSEHLSHDWHMKLHATDKITVFPPEVVLVLRVAALLRGLGLSLQYNIDISEKWYGFAKAAVQAKGAV
jgi:aarF domain-containing kinase